MADKHKVEKYIDENCSSDSPSHPHPSKKFELFSNKVITSQENLDQLISASNQSGHSALAFDFIHKVRKSKPHKGFYAYCIFNAKQNQKINTKELKPSESSSVNSCMVNGLMSALKATEAFKSKPLYILTKSEFFLKLLKQVDANASKENFSLPDVDPNLLKLLIVTLKYRNIQFIKSSKQIKIFEDLHNATSK